MRARRPYILHHATYLLTPYRVHTLILSARSPVLHAMLHSNMVERIQGVINIEVMPLV